MSKLTARERFNLWLRRSKELGLTYALPPGVVRGACTVRFNTKVEPTESTVTKLQTMIQVPRDLAILLPEGVLLVPELSSKGLMYRYATSEEITRYEANEQARKDRWANTEGD